MKNVAVVGADGFLGGMICTHFEQLNAVTRITRANYSAHMGKTFDVLVNANGNSRRYWADIHPMEDFEASTMSVYHTLLDFNVDTYVYISSADVYGRHNEHTSPMENTPISTRHLSPYGLHKYLAECLVQQHAKRFLILRCSALIGSRMKKGPFKDMGDGSPLYITLDSKLQFISIHEVARIVDALLDAPAVNEVFNVGGEGALTCRELEILFNTRFSVRADAQRQVYEMDVRKTKQWFPLKQSMAYVQAIIKQEDGD